MSTTPSNARQLWLNRYQSIRALQQRIIETLQQQDENLMQRLNDLILQQDREIRSLPFSDLSAEDVDTLSDDIDQLKQDLDELKGLIETARQTIMEQTSKLKQTGRNIKAYQQTQDF